MRRRRYTGGGYGRPPQPPPPPRPKIEGTAECPWPGASQIMSGRSIRLVLDSWGTFVDMAENAPAAGCRSSRSNDMGAHWHGTSTFREAAALAREGWPEGEARVRGLSLAAFDKVSSMLERELPVYDVEGAEIDVARYLEGEPECWQRMESRVTQGPGRRIVEIVYVCSASGGVSGEVMIARGAAAVALAELLEQAGHGVKITLVSSVASGYGGHGKEACEICIPIKAPDQPLDVSRVAFALAHPATFRRLVFAVEETLPPDIVSAYGFRGGGGYGARPFEASEHGDIYIGGAAYGHEQWTDPHRARAWIIEQLKAQGVALNEDAA